MVAAAYKGTPVASPSTRCQTLVHSASDLIRIDRFRVRLETLAQVARLLLLGFEPLSEIEHMPNKLPL